jgi:SAM-dependent methyltransferase
MSSLSVERRPDHAAGVKARLEEYYTRYYRDTLGIPQWRDLVDLRLGDHAYESRRLTRLEQLLARSVGGLSLLNIGCGPGGFNAVAQQAGARAWGIDSSAEAVSIAAARVPGGRFLCADAMSLPFRDRRFDLVYCYSTLEHVADAGRVLREIVRVLRPGGRLYLHAPNRWGCFEGHYKVLWAPGLPRWLARLYLAARGRPTGFLDTLRPVTLRGCRRLLEAAGARVTLVSNEDAHRPHGGPIWPLVRLYYRLFGVHPSVELVAVSREDR